MSTADIKTKLKDLIEQESDPNVLDAVDAIFAQKDFDPLIQKEMISRALKSEKDIKEGKVYTIEEAETRLNKRLGL